MRYGALSCVRALLCIPLLTLALASSSPAGELPVHRPDPNASRDEIPAVYRWDLTALFDDDEAWNAAMEAIGDQLSGLDAHRGHLTDPRHLREALDLYFDLHDRTNHCTLYANLGHAVALDDARSSAMQDRSLALMDEVMARAGFLRAEILAMSDEQIARAFDDQPGLRRHRPYIENLRRRRDRVLGEEAERVLGLLGDNLWAEIDLNEIPSALESAFGALLTDIEWPSIVDEEGNTVRMTLASYPRYRASADREVRRAAVQAFLQTLHRYRHAFAATLGGQFELDVALARARHYDRAVDAYLDKDGLDPAVLENLVRTIRSRLEPLHRYVRLRREVMGIDEVHLYDLYVPLTETSAGATVDFATARRTILEGLAPLGERYGTVLEEGLDPANGWLDLYPHANKRSGAFSASVYGRHPYVLMNYQQQTDDMFTLAHEYGHALHSHFSMEAQPYSAYRYAPFLAEVASTCNEALLADHLLARAASDEERIALLVERAENIRTTIYRQTLFAEFELRAHEMVEQGLPVTADALQELYAGLVRTYYGPDYALDEFDGMEWAYVPHFYYKYYVFTYATGLSSGLAIAERVREQGEPAVEGLMEMLRGGNSAPPLELLARAGVDLTEPAPIEAAAGVFADTVRELESLLLPSGSGDGR